MKPLDSSQNYWQGKARLVAWRWNFATWLNLFLYFAAAASFAMMCALLVIRRTDATSLTLAWEIFAGTLVLGALVCHFVSRRKFYTQREALVRLDASLRLNNRLTSAADGVGEWPQESENPTPDGLHWRWQRIFVPTLASLAVLLFAANVPIPLDKLGEQHHKEEPLAWSHIESQVETLKKQDIVSEESLMNLKEQVDQLRKQSSDNWYSHSSLEASDNLQAKANDAIHSLQRDMETMLNTLNAAQQGGDNLSSDQLQQLGAQFNQALQGLQMGTLPLNKETLNQLKNIDPNQLKNLTQQQMQQLQQNMQKGISGCKSCFNPGDGQQEMLNNMIQNQGQQQPSGHPGGGGPAELGLKPDETHLDTNRTEHISNDDLSHAAAGDLAGITKGKHNVDQTQYNGPASAGAINGVGSGGEAVWKNQLTPQEREVLERFYK